MSTEWLIDALQTVDEALQGLAADESDAAITYTLTRIHGATEYAFQEALQAAPNVPAHIKQEIVAGQPNFPTLVDWVGTYFPHVVDDALARRLKKFNTQRNRAVHGRRDSVTGRAIFEVPRADDARAMGRLTHQVLEGLGEAIAAPPGERQPAPTAAKTPDQPVFPGQHPGETVIFKLRRHWFILLTWLIPPLLLFFATAGVGVIIGLVLTLPTLPWLGLILLLSIGPLGLTVWRFLDWENDHYILTDERILHIERVYFLFESREEAPLERIQDVYVKMPTLAANVLYFGDVEIQTAAMAGQIRFSSVPKPRKVQRLIFREAGLPEPGTEETERWRPERSRMLRPLESFTRMLYPVIPRGGDVIVWRKHWFILFTRLLRPLMAALLLGLLLVVLIVLDAPMSVGAVPQFVIVGVPAILFLTLVGWIAWITIDWHNDLYILTDTHVIDIEKRPFTLELRREANMGMIQNVSYEQPTFVSKLLNYGNTKLETAGRTGEFTFDNVPRPRYVQEVITRRLTAFRQRNQPQPAPRTRAELEQALQEILDERYGLSPRRPG